MKIIHIITGLNNGGAEGVLYRLCQFDPNHHHIVISMMGEGKYGPLLRDAGISVYCLNIPQGRFLLSGLWQLYKLLRMHKPDVVQTWMYHADLIGGIVAKTAGIKSIYWNVRHTTLEIGQSKRSTIWVAKACALLSAWIPKKIIYCAHEAKTVHVKLGYKIDKSEVVGNGYDLTQFRLDEISGAAVRTEIKLTEESVLIGMVGRFDPQKDHFNLVDALSLVKKTVSTFNLVLIGRDLDSANKELNKHIAEKDLTENVILLGQRTDIPAVMNSLDINVLSSSFGEGFPNVVAEAMACGTPCVTTKVGDTAIIVGNTGWVVPPKNPQALANAILEAMAEKENNPRVWKARKKACCEKIVNNFSIDKMVEGYHNVWFK